MNMEIQPVVRKTESGRGKSPAFVKFIVERCQADKGFRAALRRADNPATEYQSWEILAGFNVNLEFENQRLPYATIAAAIAKANVEKNGVVNIGQAVARCYEDGAESDQAKAKLRRLLGCDSIPELCRILRPLFSLIESKATINLDYASLLDDLLWFSDEDRQIQIRARWAQQFYSKKTNGANDE